MPMPVTGNALAASYARNGSIALRPSIEANFGPGGGHRGAEVTAVQLFEIASKQIYNKQSHGPPVYL